MKKLVEVQFREIKKNETFQTLIFKELKSLKDCDYMGIQTTQKRNTCEEAKKIDKLEELISSGSHSSRLRSRRAH
jgi:hypothetical protein